MASAQTLSDQITAAIGAHGVWKTRLTVAIQTGRSEFAVDVVRKDDQCPFGKWLYGGTDPSTRSSQHYHTVKALHAEFHKQAAEVLRQALSGRKEQAARAMDRGQPYAQASATLTSAMMAWKSANG